MLLLLRPLFLNFVVVVVGGGGGGGVEHFNQLIKMVFVWRKSIYVLSASHNAKL